MTLSPTIPRIPRTANHRAPLREPSKYGISTPAAIRTFQWLIHSLILHIAQDVRTQSGSLYLGFVDGAPVILAKDIKREG